MPLRLQPTGPFRSATLLRTPPDWETGTFPWQGVEWEPGCTIRRLVLFKVRKRVTSIRYLPYPICAWMQSAGKRGGGSPVAPSTHPAPSVVRFNRNSLALGLLKAPAWGDSFEVIRGLLSPPQTCFLHKCR